LSPDEKIARIAERQHGVFAFVQALSCGLSPDQIQRRVRRGLWVRVYRGVYRLAGSTMTFASAALAAVLAAGEGAAASYATAGVLWQTENITSPQIHVSVLGRRRLTIPDVMVHRPTSLVKRDIVPLGVIPVTSPARTIIDLAGLVDEDTLEDVLDDLWRRERVDVAYLYPRVCAMPKQGRRGLLTLERLLKDRDGTRPSGSGRENRLRRLLLAAGLPPPERQHEVRAPDGTFIAFVDLAYPAAKLFIEFDGDKYHSTRRQRAADAVRQNKLVALGWSPLRITSDEQDNAPQDIIRLVSGVLTARRTV
jgi:hypothetical protein